MIDFDLASILFFAKAMIVNQTVKTDQFKIFNLIPITLKKFPESN